jgi:hypothetical protein
MLYIYHKSYPSFNLLQKLNYYHCIALSVKNDHRAITLILKFQLDLKSYFVVHLLLIANTDKLQIALSIFYL